MRRWYSEDDLRPGELVELAEFNAARVPGLPRSLARRAEHRRALLAITKLRTAGGIAQVEDVYTVPEARGRGFARTLVSHGGRARSGRSPDLIFITADDNDWPQQLYARIGFRPLGRIWLFHHS